MEIDIDREGYYEFGNEETRERTRDRLSEMINMGMNAFPNTQFGVDGLLLGVWVECVWSDSNERWDSRMEWAEGLIEKNRKSYKRWKTIL